MSRRGAGVILAGLLGLQSCAAQPGGAPADRAGLAAQALHQDSQCGEAFSRPAVVWIDSAPALSKVYRALSRQRIPPLAPPAVDFSRNGVLLIAMGQRPSAGFGLEIEGIRVSGATLEVTVDWQEPLPGYLQAQVITQPCVLLSVPALDFGSIQVLDRTGQVRISGRH